MFAEIMAVLPELDGDILLYYRSKPHHDGRVMTGCDADAIADGTVSDIYFEK